jgi:DNA-binding CsgD family transcriptional regulator
VGARAAADIAESSRDLRDDDGAAAAAAAGRALADGLDQRFALVESATPAPEALTYRRQLEAELTRAEGRPDPAQWGEVAARWEELGLRPAAAYCAWRQGEVLVAVGDRAGAEAALSTAYAHASATGAQPLVDEIEALGRRSRIAVGGSAASASADDDTATVTAAERLGLTARELDVLGLVVEGRTNRQIGEHLFISEKTASVHVSRILAKLDVANRGEAAAIARRLGLTAT